MYMQKQIVKTYSQHGESTKMDKIRGIVLHV